MANYRANRAAPVPPADRVEQHRKKLETGAQEMARQELARRARARENLLDFTSYTMPQYRAGKPHRLICSKLEAVERGDIKRLMIFCPPRTGKSELSSIRFPSWYLGRNPKKQIITASYGADLAQKFGRDTRNTVASKEFGVLFPGVGISADSAARGAWHTNQGGSYVATGVGGGLTGYGADVALCDDMVRDRQDAESETVREGTWDWYRSVLRTRLMPGGAIVLIMCMTGDTRVLRPNGTETLLRDIRPGDVIATYRDGKLSSSKVVNWVNHGSDSVYEIRTTSGIIVKANERHPFLVQVGEDLKWLRLKDLRPGQKICRVNGASGKVRRASGMGATNLSRPEAIANRTMVKSDLRTALGRLLKTQRIGALGASRTATVSLPKNMSVDTQSRAVSARFAGKSLGRMSALIGVANCALTIATTKAVSARYFAMTAISLLDTLRQQIQRRLFLNTCDFTLDRIEQIRAVGTEDVFDIEVEETENFIANGLVSHNTRWHQSDVAGRLLEDMRHGSGEHWEVVNLPAIAGEGDILGRQPGEALWPESYDLDALAAVRQSIGEREWAALYQQDPRPQEGALFKVALIDTLDAAPKGTQIVRAWDLAATKKMGSRDPDWTVGLKLLKTREGGFVVLDIVRFRGGPEEVLQAIVRTARQDGHGVKIGLPADPGQAGKMQVLYLTRALAGYRVDSSPETGDKSTRAAPVASQINVGNFAVVKNLAWNKNFLEELADFPSGSHDDQVDALSRAFAMLGAVDMMKRFRALV